MRIDISLLQICRPLAGAILFVCSLGSAMIGICTRPSLADALASSNGIHGHYMEARTCQVYTGPCFANGEMGMAGKDAVMAWKIETGSHAGVALDGLSIAMVVRASNTLGHQGFNNAESIRSMVVIDERANDDQRLALLEFVKSQAGKATANIEEVRTAPIGLSLDLETLNGTLTIDKLVKLEARKARPGDCICSNESAFYPPLNQLTGAVPGVTIEGEVTARSLGTRWSIPDSRTAYLGVFEAP